MPAARTAAAFASQHRPTLWCYLTLCQDATIIGYHTTIPHRLEVVALDHRPSPWRITPPAKDIGLRVPCLANISIMSHPATTLAPSPAAAVSSERTKEELELAERLIEHSQGIQRGPSHPDRRSTPSSTDGESRSGADTGESRLSDDGAAQTRPHTQQPGQSQQQQQQPNLQLPSIHELTWVKQRKPFNTGMGGAGQVCRYAASVQEEGIARG